MTATRATRPLPEGTQSERSRREAAVRLSRHARASAAPAAVGLVLLSALVVVGVAPGWASVAASLAGMAVTYGHDRRRTPASVRGRSPRGPLWVAPATGLVLSTMAVHVVAVLSATWPPAGRAAAADLASLASYGAWWLARFALLDQAAWAAERSGGAAVG